MKTKTWMKKYAMAAGFVTVFCLMADAGRAATLALYEFNQGDTQAKAFGVGQVTPYITTDSEPNSVASDFIFGGLANSSASAGRSTVSPNVNTIFVRGPLLTTSEAAAVSGNDYFEFTLTPSAGYQLDLTGFQFAADNVSATLSWTSNFALRSNLDGFASNIGTVSDAAATTSSYTNLNISLAGAQFQALTSAITFRLYLYQTGTNALDNNAVSRMDTFTINGAAVAVPEPSACAMSGAGLAVLWVLRRKKFMGKA